MSWADLFDRAEAYATDVETIRETLAVHRTTDADATGEESDA